VQLPSMAVWPCTLCSNGTVPYCDNDQLCNMVHCPPRSHEVDNTMEAAPGGIWQTRTAAAPAAAAERYAPVPHLQLCCLPVWQVADEWCLAELNKGWLTLNTAIIKNLTLPPVHSEGVGRTLHGGGGQRTGRHRHIYSDGVGGTRHGGGRGEDRQTQTHSQ
jgi:hypothetical protein